MFDKLKCAYYVLRLNDTVRKCDQELTTNCGKDASMEQCIDYLHSRGDASFPSAAKLDCIRTNNPEYFNKAFKSCAKAGLNPMAKF